MATKAIVALIVIGVLVSALAASMGGATAPSWLGLGAALVLIGIIAALSLAFVRLARRRSAHAGQSLYQQARQPAGGFGMPTLTMRKTAPDRIKPLWQSQEAFDEEKQDEPIPAEAFRYMPRPSTHWAKTGTAVPRAEATAEGSEVPRSSPPQAPHTAEKPAESTAESAVPDTQAPAAEAPEGSVPAEAEATAQAGEGLDEAPPIRWVPAGVSVKIAGATIRGGMIYVGVDTSRSGDEVGEPALIDLDAPVGDYGDYRQALDEFWPHYGDITPIQRRAYLNWLAQGRSDPEADIGHVFLYFYGLERRILLDGMQPGADRNEFVDISVEVERLLSIYGRNQSFGRHANQLLGAIAALTPDVDHYLRSLPALGMEANLPFFFKIVLGQAAVNRYPLPPGVALAWARHSPDIVLSGPARRSPELFEAAFRHRYTEALGSGLVLPVNRTRLKHDYHGASAALRDRAIRLSLDALPDVSVLTGPIRKLREVIEQATDDLDAYSRYLERHPGQAASMEALILLPIHLWPDQALKRITRLRARLQHEMVIMSLRGLCGELGIDESPSLSRLQEVLNALEKHRIAIEPDVRQGAAMPRPDDPVVLFELEPHEVPDHADAKGEPDFRVFLLSVHLAFAVASADDSFSDDELQFLHDYAEDSPRFSDVQRRRLKAIMRLARSPLHSIERCCTGLYALDTQEKERIARILVDIARADGHVTPVEMRLLERIYRVIGLDAIRLFTDTTIRRPITQTLQTAGKRVSSGVVWVQSSTPGGFKLDGDHVSELGRDSDHVAKFLSGVVSGDERVSRGLAPVSVPKALMAEPVHAGAELRQAARSDHAQIAGLRGLDESLTGFVRALMRQDSWSRDELEALSEDLGLELDAALEKINEAALNARNKPLTRGDDIVVINADFMQQLPGQRY